MPLLNVTLQKKSKKTPFSLNLESSLLDEIKAYCTWANIESTREFAAQAFSYILKNDKDWQKHISQPKTGNFPTNKSQ